jgi:hypothetical protein
MWTLFLPIVERATRKSVHINNDYVDILKSVYISNGMSFHSGVTLEVLSLFPWF